MGDRVVYEPSAIVELYRRGLWSERRCALELMHWIEASCLALELNPEPFAELWYVAAARPPSCWPGLFESLLDGKPDWPAAPVHLTN